MDASKCSLGIVQGVPTQFDGPLFARLHRHPQIELSVYYTQHGDIPHDPELGHRPGWDHGILGDYRWSVAERGALGQVELLRKIVAAGHDLVVVSDYRSIVGLGLPLLGRIVRCSVGLRIDSILQDQAVTSWKWSFKRRILSVLFRLFDTAHPVGKWSREYLRALGYPDERVFLFPYSIDTDYLQAQHLNAMQDREGIRARMEIPALGQVILGVMKFHPREDPLTLLRAYADIAASFPATYLVLVGDGPLRAEIDNFVRERGLDRVRLPGYLPYSQLAGMYAIADLFVHPAIREPWGVSVHEAIVCGVPVVTSDRVGSSADLVLPPKTGEVFRVGDAKHLATILCSLLGAPLRLAACRDNTAAVVPAWRYDRVIENLLDAMRRSAPQKLRQT